MSLDLSTLRRAVKRLKATHDARPDARQSTGATALIRAALPEIRRLRDAEGQPWAVIAAALAEQGVCEGRDRRPISADRLIALVRHIEGQLGRAAAQQVKRTRRSDLGGPAARPARPADPTPLTGRPRLSSDLQPQARSEPEDTPLSEAEIRRLQAEKHSHLFKKD